MTTSQQQAADQWRAELVDLFFRFSARDLPDLTEPELDRMHFLLQLLSPTGDVADLMQAAGEDQ